MEEEDFDDDNPSEYTACKHLVSNGFQEVWNGCWIKPHPDYRLTQKDHAALGYLINEWDMEYLSSA